LFLGEFQHTLDPKGRIIIPSSYRDKLKEKFMMTKGLEQCLFIFPMPEWDKLVEKLQGLPLSNYGAREFTRYFYSSASECEMDSQYRILIPPSLRKHAELEKEVYITGVGTRVEVWDKNRWENLMGSETLLPESVSNTFALLGI